MVIEKYQLQVGDWEDSGVILKEEIKKDKTHMIIFNDTEGISLPVQTPMHMNDYGDRIILIVYDNIIYPVPNMYFISILQSIVAELKYDKTNSAVSTYHKKWVVYDKATK
jgi:hypothetical protein